MPRVLSGIVDHTGQSRALGHKAGDRARFLAQPRLPESLLVPKEKWREFDDSPDSDDWIKDQGQVGACEGHSTALSLEHARHVAGEPRVKLSGWYPYSILCKGVDTGAYTFDALKVAMKGLAPESEVPWGTIDPRKLTPESKDQAKRFKVEGFAAVHNALELMTAIQLRRSVNGCVCVGEGFDQLDAEGVPTLWDSWTNHAVTFALGAKHSRKWGWLVLMWNSWGLKWGLRGKCWVPLEVAANRWWEGYAVSVPSIDPLDEALNRRPPGRRRAA